MEPDFSGVEPSVLAPTLCVGAALPPRRGAPRWHSHAERGNEGIRAAVRARAHALRGRGTAPTTRSVPLVFPRRAWERGELLHARAHALRGRRTAPTTRSVPLAFPRRAWERGELLHARAHALRGRRTAPTTRSVPLAFPRRAWERGGRGGPGVPTRSGRAAQPAPAHRRIFGATGCATSRGPPGSGPVRAASPGPARGRPPGPRPAKPVRDTRRQRPRPATGPPGR